LEAARTMPGGQEKIEALEKSRTAAQCGRCRRDFIREAWQATEVGRLSWRLLSLEPTSVVGTFETWRPALTMSVCRGRPEVVGRRPK
jgi:hypothetical protein